MLIQFLKNRDGITTTFLVDHQVINDEVPYIPERVMDHRGLNLFLFLTESGFAGEDLEYGEGADENFNELLRGFNYMFNPVHVKEAIEATEKSRLRRRY